MLNKLNTWGTLFQSYGGGGFLDQQVHYNQIVKKFYEYDSIDPFTECNFLSQLNCINTYARRVGEREGVTGLSDLGIQYRRLYMKNDLGSYICVRTLLLSKVTNPFWVGQKENVSSLSVTGNKHQASKTSCFAFPTQKQKGVPPSRITAYRIWHLQKKTQKVI